MSSGDNTMLRVKYYEKYLAAQSDYRPGWSSLGASTVAAAATGAGKLAVASTGDRGSVSSTWGGSAGIDLQQQWTRFSLQGALASS